MKINRTYFLFCNLIIMKVTYRLGAFENTEEALVMLLDVDECTNN